MVYLLHFNRPISPKHTCQHYIGFAETFSRIIDQRKGNAHAARLCQVAKERDIDFIVARVWPDADRTFERRMKNRKNAPRMCPVCNGQMLIVADIDFYSL